MPEPRIRVCGDLRRADDLAVFRELPREILVEQSADTPEDFRRALDDLNPIVQDLMGRIPNGGAVSGHGKGSFSLSW